MTAEDISQKPIMTKLRLFSPFSVRRLFGQANKETLASQNTDLARSIRMLKKADNRWVCLFPWTTPRRKG